MEFVQVTQGQFEKMIRYAEEDKLRIALAHCDENIADLRKQFDEALERKQEYETELKNRKGVDHE